ncbi:UL16-binding protein 1-like [Ochotona princeps]|uniref:UL16-binding protein 1-like n=1 Tax=Ochotona princeps TaxID=9978 RepID=UPI002714A82C|nr:UL16-binding protein 1-like [Ochotona princeps]
MNDKEHRSEEVRSQGCRCHGQEVISLISSPIVHGLLSVLELEEGLSVSRFLVINVTCIFSFTDAHSLCHRFTVIPRARSGQQVCDVQGYIDGKIFLTGTCHKANCFILLGNETLIPDNEEKAEMNPADDTSRVRTHALSLQASMCCVREATGRTHGSWLFNITF